MFLLTEVQDVLSYKVFLEVLKQIYDKWKPLTIFFLVLSIVKKVEYYGHIFRIH